MILEFPNLDTLKLALTSDAIPARLASARAEAATGEDGQVYVTFRGRLKRPEAAALGQLGVSAVKSCPVATQESVSCWMQILPVQADQAALTATEKTPVLFDLPDDGTLSDVVNEMLRLGNDRQTYCSVTGNGESRVLLRVTGPPYYSLLRALEGDSTNGSPRAFIERQSRVWVEIGNSHPLADRLTPPPGKLLFLRPPHDWTLVDEAPFRDIYEVLEFPLPDEPSSLSACDLGRRLQVPMRLERGGANDVAELWVLRESAVQQIDDFVQTAPDQLVGRLSFAVSEREGRDLVVLRLRPSKLPPPVLVLDALACSCYQKFPNLFLPTGQRLHPQLRRDVIKALLADDASVITWLDPHDEGGFTPCRIQDSAFRPLADWVDYILDRDHEDLTAWIEASRFDFEPFICADDKPDRTKSSQRKPTKKPDRKPAKSAGTPATQRTFGRPQKSDKRPRRGAARAISHVKKKPSEVEKHLQDLERSFLELEAPLDAPGRIDLWREMAAANGALRRSSEAGICWTHVVWEDETPDADDLWDWLLASTQGWKTFESRCDEEDAARDLVDDVLTTTNPGPTTVNRAGGVVDLVRCGA